MVVLTELLEDVSNEAQDDSSPGRPVVGEAAIDAIMLGAPFDDDSDTTHKTPQLPPISSVITTACRLQPTEPPHLQIEAGCVWDRDNWSCAYDAVFMSFWSIYKNSPPGWRNEWRQQTSEWNDFLGEAFDSLLAAAQNGQTSQAALSHKFTFFREMFRDKLSQIDPVSFRRHGAALTSVCRILGHILNGSAECEPYLNQVVACDWCGTSMDVRCSFSLIGSTQTLDKYLNDNDISPPLPLQTAVTCYIQRASWEPWRNRCSTCSRPPRVESLSIPEMTWLWVELCDVISPIIPSCRLVFGLPHQQQVYVLQAVIYHGGDHFTARLSSRSAAWWKYDGMWMFGAPHVDHIENEADLLKNDDRRAAFLLYRRADFQD